MQHFKILIEKGCKLKKKKNSNNTHYDKVKKKVEGNGIENKYIIIWSVCQMNSSLFWEVLSWKSRIITW